MSIEGKGPERCMDRVLLMTNRASMLRKRSEDSVAFRPNHAFVNFEVGPDPTSRVQHCSPQAPHSKRFHRSQFHQLQEQENGDADSDDGDVECAILFNGKNIELRVLDETVAGLRVQRKREEEEESGMVSKRLDIGDAAGVRNKRKKVV